MTAEKFHDAIGLLSTDLVVETDKKRRRKPKVVQWKRWTAMAACFALLCGSWFVAQALIPKGATECAADTAMQPEAPAAAEAAPMEAAEEPASGQPITGGSSGSTENGELRTDTTDEKRNVAACSFETPLKPTSACFSSASRITLLHSREELEEYLAHYDWMYDFQDVQTEAYIDAWFENHDLLLIAEHCIPVGSDCCVTALTEQDDVFQVCISTAREDPGEPPETTQWHLFVELEKGIIMGEDSVMLIYE